MGRGRINRPRRGSPTMSDHDDAGTAVAEPIVSTRSQPRADHSTRTRRQPPYHVIVLNDEEHTYEYVIEMLGKVFGHSRATGMEMARTIDTTGRAIVLTTHKE